MISNKCQYALRAMLELARHHAHGPVSTSTVAEAQQIPARFLEAILRQLKQAGLASSQRGKEGGYSLTRRPVQVTVGEIILLFEGPLVAADREKKGRPTALDHLWQEAEEALNQVYNQTTLQDLIDRDLELRSINDYTI